MGFSLVLFSLDFKWTLTIADDGRSAGGAVAFFLR